MLPHAAPTFYFGGVSGEGLNYVCGRCVSGDENGLEAGVERCLEVDLGDGSAECTASPCLLEAPG